MRPRGTPGELERRRRKALELLKSGVSHAEIARQLEVDRRSVYRWEAAKKQGGLRALRSRPTPGRPPKMNREQRRRLERILLAGARKAGYESDLWTCQRIADVIRAELDVEYHVDHIGRLLHSMGWSPQKPERRAIERDEVKIGGWVRDTWPEIKKKPGTNED